MMESSMQTQYSSSGHKKKKNVIVRYKEKEFW